MKLLCSINEDREEVAFRESGLAEGHELLFQRGPVTPSTIPAEAGEVELLTVFVDSVINAEVLAQFPQLKLVATRSTGFDHIDLATCKERGIVVSNVPTYGANTVAEHAFALLLSLSKRVFDGYEQVREGRGFNPHSLRGFDLMGKTIGIVGTGNIGRNAVAIAKGFSMKVLAFDVHPDQAYADEMGIRYTSLEELLEQSDVVSLHVPYIEATHHLINCDTIELMKPGSVLINTARGPIVETKALVHALKTGRLRGAGLDVLEEEGAVHDEAAFLEQAQGNPENIETMLANHILIDHPQVIVTPHSAFNTDEALARISDTSIANIKSFVAGNPQNTIEA